MPKPRPQTVQEAIKGKPYEKNAIPFLTNLMNGAASQFTQMRDLEQNIPRTIDREPNPANLNVTTTALFLWENALGVADPAPRVKGKYGGLTMARALATQYHFVDGSNDDEWPRDENDEPLTDEQVTATAAEKLETARKMVLDEYHDWVEEHKNEENFSLFKDMLDLEMIALDVEAGDFTAAVVDSPYLYGLYDQNAGMPKFESVSREKLVEELGGVDDPEIYDEPLGKTAKPMKDLAAFFKAQTALFKAEYRKQDMMQDGYSPEDEKDYLRQLGEATAQEIEAFDKLRALEIAHPRKFDDTYLNNNLDHITGVHGKEARDCYRQVGYLRGQKQAIENGWGMHELAHLGALGELKASAEWEIRHHNYLLTTNEVKITPEERKNLQANVEQDQALLRDLKTLEEPVMQRKVTSASDKYQVLATISDFLEAKKAQYPDSAIKYVYDRALPVFVKEAKEHTMKLPGIGASIEALKEGKRGTWFGKEDYDSVIQDMEALNELYKQNADACLEKGPIAAIPKLEAKQHSLLAKMNAYMTRKEREFAKNKAANKSDNANSRRRYDAMSEAMKALKERMATEKTMEEAIKGRAPISFDAPAVDAPQAEAPKNEGGAPAFDPAAKRAALQQELIDLGTDGVPSKNDIKAELAGILTASLLMSLHKDGKIGEITEGLFKKTRNTMEVHKGFETLIENTDSKTLFEHATRGKGQDLYNDFCAAIERSRKAPAVQERTSVLQKEAKKDLAL